MDAVAECAGVSRPLVYKHFANRGELLTAAYRREAQRVGREVAEAVRAASSLEGRYRALVHAALSASARRGALLQALRSAGAFNRELRQEQRAQDRQTVLYFARQATAELDIQPDAAEAVAGMLLTALESVLGQYRARRTLAHARLLEETYMDMVTGALETVARRTSGGAAVVAPAGEA